MLINELQAMDNVTIMTNATVLGYYDDGVITIDQNDHFMTMKPERLVIATGASERMVAFPNNDLPGVYGAGAVQTLMNLYGVVPAAKVLMIGAGNIGLIVSYQLMQAGVKVQAVLDAGPRIGGYLVHAAKIRRAGVPIMVRHTVKEALGTDRVEGAIVHQLDDNWQPIPGSQQKIECDAICLAVGLSPLSDILWQANCQMKYVPELGGHVAVRDDQMQTTVPGIYLAGDVAGVEEASSAMVEGRLAGLNAAGSLGHTMENLEEVRKDLMAQLDTLRAGPVGEKIRQGLSRLVG
jgi:sarcosine oxidase subunit alpha